MKICSYLGLLATVAITTIHAQGEIAAPKITYAPKNMKVAEDLIVSFFCKASGYPPPTFHWERDGKQLNTKKHNRYEVLSMPHGSVLRIEPVKERKDAKTFTCVATNEHGEARANAILTVYPGEEYKIFDPLSDIELVNPELVEIETEPFNHSIPQGYPRIVENPRLKAVQKDHEAILMCRATVEGLPNPPDIYWLKDYRPVDVNDPRIQMSEDGTLTIERSQESDIGKYECVAENEVGVAYSFAAMLYVKTRRVPPHFTQPPEDVEADPGSDVNITCVAVGSPMPRVLWREGARDLHSGEIADIPIGRNILMLKDVRESKNYTCVASSTLGNIESDVLVKVKAMPNPPVKLTASDITPSSLKLAWKSGNTENVQSYIIQYKLKHDPGDYRQIIGIRDTEYMIEQMLPYQQYELRVIAVTKLGRSMPSAPIEIVTGELGCHKKLRSTSGRCLCESEYVANFHSGN